MAPQAQSPAGLVSIPLAEIKPSKTNPRRAIDPASITELTESIRVHGVLQPVVVRLNGAGYELVAGHRRFAAAQLADLEEIPAAVRKLSDQEALEIHVIENLERSDLHPLEEAEGYRRLMKDHGYTVERLAERTHKSIKYIYDRVKLLQLTKDLQRLFLEGKITAGHAILLARLKPEDQKRVADPSPERRTNGLWEGEHTLFDDEDDEAQRDNAYAGLKLRSVRETQSWIDEHVRFNVQKDVDPMLFPETKKELDLAGTGSPGRAVLKKIIGITRLHFIQPEAREGRTYGPRSWKRADGQLERKGQWGKPKPTKTCEHSVTGFVAIGPGRGEAFAVCISKDKCAVHWGAEIKARKQREKSGSTRTQSRERSDDAYERQRRRQQLEHRAWSYALESIHPAFAAKVRALSWEKLRKAALATIDFRGDEGEAGLIPPGESAEEFVKHLLWCALLERINWHHDAAKTGKEWGVDVAGMRATALKAIKAGVEGHCRTCGCTESDACDGGCSWVDEDKTLCSKCAPVQTSAKASKSGSGKTRPKKGKAKK